MTHSGRNERGVWVRTVHETNLPWEISIGKGEKKLRLFIYFNMKPPFFKRVSLHGINLEEEASRCWWAVMRKSSLCGQRIFSCSWPHWLSIVWALCTRRSELWQFFYSRKSRAFWRQNWRSILLWNWVTNCGHWRVVGRGYFSQGSSQCENVAFARRVFVLLRKIDVGMRGKYGATLCNYCIPGLPRRRS